MPLATFQTYFAQSAIDREQGVIRGVRVMELGKLAKFAAIKDDGGKIHKEVTISDAHISALMAHAGNRSIPVHLTHAAANAKQDGLSTKAGTLKTFRTDESGHLLADLHLVPGDVRELALWHAENDPENMMLSAVYSFLPEDSNCIPQDFQAADLVEKGAGVTALLAEDSTTNTMPDDTSSTQASADLVQQLVAACQDPHALAAFKALIKSVESAADSAAEEADSTDKAADLVVNDDAGAVATMAAFEKKMEEKLTAALANFENAKKDIAIAAKAEVVAELGNAKIPAPKTEKTETALFGLDRVKANIKAQLSKN